MKPILYAENTTSFLTNGFGRMSDAISCKVVEERNGEYELTMTYPINGKHFSELSERMLLYAIHDEVGDRQPFRIYEISKPLNGIVTVRARHVSYDLKNIVISPFTAGSLPEALSGLSSHSSSANPFSFNSSGSQTVANFSVEVPTSCRSLLGGMQGSILDVYGGEYEWDHWNVNLRVHRGSDKNVTISYGKNLTELEDTLNVANTYNAVYPFWKGSSGESGEGRIVYISDDPAKRIVKAEIKDEDGNPVDIPLEVVPLDLSSAFNNSDGAPTQTALRERAEAYLKNNQPWLENRNVTVSFVPLWQTEEYKNLTLERVSLCDIVNVVHRKLGVVVKKKVTKVEFDVLNERYVSMTLGGTASQSLSSALSADFSEVKNSIIDKSVMDAAINHATEMIRGGLGGYVIINTDVDGRPIELVIADDMDLSKAIKVWRWNQNGLGFSSDGYDGGEMGYSLAMTSDGAIVADRITTGKLNADIIKTGVLSDEKGNTTINMSTGTMTAKKLSIDSENFDLTESGILTAKSATLNNATIAGRLTSIRSDLSYITIDNGEIDFYGLNSSLKTELAHVENATQRRYYHDLVVSFHPDKDTNYAPVIHYNLKHDAYGSIFNRLNEFVGIMNMAVSDHIAFGTKITTTTDVIPETVILPEDTVEVRGCKYTDGGNLIEVDGGVNVTDTKHRVVETKNYGRRALSSVESASYLFSDIGSGQTDENGKAFVFIDPAFLETVDEKHEYQVFLTNTKQGGELYVEKEDGYFIVNGPSNVSFDWVIYARQKGYAANRLENIERVRPVNDIDKLYYSLANAYDPSIDESVSKYLEQYESEVSGYDN